jgi:P27 family predicted phage terminase small subunit
MPKDGEEFVPPTFDKLPDPPEWLDEVGQKEWHRVGPHLLKAGLLTEADLIPFAAYCANVQIMVKALIDIEDDGMTIPGARGAVRNPALAAFSSSTNSLRSLAAEFGLTPSSRSRMKLPGDDGESLEDLLGDEGTEDAS